MTLKHIGYALGVVLGLLVIYGVYWWMRSSWIEPGYVGLIYDARGGVQSTIYRPQRIVVGLGQRLYTYPTKVQSAIYSQDPEDGETRDADGIGVTTGDGNTIILDVSVNYRVQEDDALKMFNNFGTLPIEEIQKQHIRGAVRDVINEVGVKYDSFTLVGTKRDEAEDAMTAMLQEKLGPKGITILNVQLGQYYPNPTMQARTGRLVNTSTQFKINEIQNKVANVDAAINQIRSTAQAESNRLRSSTTAVKSLELQSLEVDLEALEKWDGNLPIILPGNAPLYLGNLPSGFPPVGQPGPPQGGE